MLGVLLAPGVAPLDGRQGTDDRPRPTKIGFGKLGKLGSCFHAGKSGPLLGYFRVSGIWFFDSRGLPALLFPRGLPTAHRARSFPLLYYYHLYGYHLCHYNIMLYCIVIPQGFYNRDTTAPLRVINIKRGADPKVW